MERSAQIAEVWESSDPPLAYAQHLLDWYGRNQRMARCGHYAIEILQLVAATATTLAATANAAGIVTAAFASLTLLLTGLRQVLDFKEKWATLTWARVQIEHEINIYRLHPVEGKVDAGRVLVSRVDGVLAAETQSWAERLRASKSTMPTTAASS